MPLTLHRTLYEIVEAADPHARLQALLDESERKQASEAYFDTYGRYPEDEPNES